LEAEQHQFAMLIMTYLTENSFLDVTIFPWITEIGNPVARKWCIKKFAT